MRSRARRPPSRLLARTLVFASLGLLFEAFFAIAFVAMDRRIRGLPPDLGYLAAVELGAAALFVAALVIGLVRERRAIAAAAASPLAAATPAARGGSDEAWRELVEAVKAASSQALAERDARSKEELDLFLATVHAMKTPATALSLMAEKAERLGEGIPASEARLELDELDRMLDRAMARLRLLDFEKGSRLRSFDVSELCRNSIKRHRRLFIARGISAEVKGSFVVESDPDWIAFVVDQLLSNAAKRATSRVLIELEAEARGQGGRPPYARIDVVDDGRGFSEEDAMRAFGRSATGGELEADRPPLAASGYGLYLAREAALRLGASLEILPSEGARLRLTLPLSRGYLSETSAR